MECLWQKRGYICLFLLCFICWVHRVQIAVFDVEECPNTAYFRLRLGHTVAGSSTRTSFFHKSPKQQS